MAQPTATEREQRQAQTILFTDIVGSSQYFAERGDAAGLKMLARHNQLLFPIVTVAGGRVVKTIGDSIFATFANPGQAVRAAWAMQRKLEEAGQGGGEEPIRIRIGIHYGLVTEQKGDVFGDAVNMAERVKSKAGGGQITLSRVVRDLLRADPRVEVRSLGLAELKGSPEAVELFELLGAPGVTPERGMRRGPVLAGMGMVLVVAVASVAGWCWTGKQKEAGDAKAIQPKAAWQEVAEVSLRYFPGDGAVQELPPEGATIFSKEKFQLLYRPLAPQYLYVAFYDAKDKSFQLVFPGRDTVQPVGIGETVEIPAEDMRFTLDEVPKQETILIILARQPIRMLEQFAHTGGYADEVVRKTLEDTKANASSARWTTAVGRAMKIEGQLGERPAWIELKIQHR